MGYSHIMDYLFQAGRIVKDGEFTSASLKEGRELTCSNIMHLFRTDTANFA